MRCMLIISTSDLTCCAAIPTPELTLCSVFQAALRLTNHQREAVVAAYAALSSQLSVAQHAFGNGAAVTPPQLLISSGSNNSAANLVAALVSSPVLP